MVEITQLWLGAQLLAICFRSVRGLPWQAPLLSQLAGQHMMKKDVLLRNIYPLHNMYLF